MTLPNDLIDELLLSYKNPEDLIGENGLLKQLTKAVIEGALQAEMGCFGSYSNATGNTRNGSSRKTLKGDKVS